jgi:elongation factor 1-gamma
LKTLEGQLASRTFLVGERLSLADFAIAAAIQFSLTVTIGSELRSELSNIIRHFETVVNQPSVKEIYGETQYIEKPLEYVAPPKEKKEQPKEKKEQPKQEKKPKKKDDDDDDDDKPIEEPKPKNPLDSLPKSTFNLEDWKRAYSNLDTRGPGGSIEWFYQQFVP